MEVHRVKKFFNTGPSSNFIPIPIEIFEDKQKSLINNSLNHIDDKYKNVLINSINLSKINIL